MSQQQNPLLFIKEVAKYFMDFLETDFHKKKLPKRAIILRNQNNLLIGFSANKYNLFSNILRKAINHGFSTETLSTISKNIYRINVPQNLLDLVAYQVNKIQDEDISNIIERVADTINRSAILYPKEFDKALYESIELIRQILKTSLISPFVESIQKPLENQNIGDENDIYTIEEELADILFKQLEEAINQILRLLFSGEKVDAIKLLSEVTNINSIKFDISTYFGSLQVGDVFNELYELEKNKTIIDKQELYLYFCDISFNKQKYPVFYLPFSIKKNESSFDISFDPQVYVNKKAIEYIAQELNISGNLQCIGERIIYLAQYQNGFKDFVNKALLELIQFFDLSGSMDTELPSHQIAKGPFVKLTNSCYITLFDKSDESLVNDYEEILQLLTEGHSSLALAFNKLIDDFIYNEPKTITLDIRENRDNQSAEEKLVFQSPIPLNQEQLQILDAIKRDDCKYTIVQGPPGTGKSHTITAIVFNAILNNQSILVLSDKKEALDVVEDKITDTINKVRLEDDFQNPVLRLGKTGNAYSKILSNSSITSITNNYLAVKKSHNDLQESIIDIETGLREEIESEIIAYKDIELSEIYECIALEDYFEENQYFIDIDEVDELKDSFIDLEELRRIFLSLKDCFINKGDASKLAILNLVGLSIDSNKDFISFSKNIEGLKLINGVIIELCNKLGSESNSLAKLKRFKKGDTETLRNLVKAYEDKEWPLVGYAFTKQKLKSLHEELELKFGFDISNNAYQNLEDLKNILKVFELTEDIICDTDQAIIKFDYLKFIHKALTDKKVSDGISGVLKIADDLDFLDKTLEKYPNTITYANINKGDINTLCNNGFTQINETEFNRLIRYIYLKQRIQKQFSDIPKFDYGEEKKSMEKLLTVQMANIMDGRLVNFLNKYQSTAISLKKIIQNKMKFPKEEFMKLKEAFPCILAGIRDFAEFIPLEPNLFDLVIIDEASQVSISQAFPALLRAKKVLILGDKKQFSNVKTAQARSEENTKYLINLKDCFIKTVSNDPVKLHKLEKFNIKASILDFFEYISNYNTQLLKYFRGYKEIISYSNKYFYQDSLQAMKIRGKAVDEVIKFTILPHDGKHELIRNSNQVEIDYIIALLKEMKENKSTETVGIITPHTNQQTLITNAIDKLPDKDYYYKVLKLKIMTFDTCQGEERDIILYSMVATLTEDHLQGIFIKDLNSVDVEEEGQIKVQRLNVGFSRAKECMHFILSKPLEEFNGSIGEALRHYNNTLQDAKKESTIDEVDQNSGMEPEVLNWFYQTEFRKKNKNNIEFKPQFELGKYLKQLDKSYLHPKYKVDFLLTYRDELNKMHKIIIEYDGFKEHFRNTEGINQFNYQSYYSEDDIYRQKVLEGYGYKFLRINKFNISKDPISALNKRIQELVGSTAGSDGIIDKIHDTIYNLQNGNMKECPKCKQVKDLNEFMDKNLKSKLGRFCSLCKKEKIALNKSKAEKKEIILVDGVNCPRCGSKMALRNGNRGEFYGCSRFPYCKGTRGA